MINKNYLLNIITQLNRTAQNRILSDEEIIEFKKIIEDIESHKTQIRIHLSEINNLKNIEDFNWELSKISVSLDNSSLVIKQLAKIYLELEHCSEQIQKINTFVFKLWFNYTSQDSILPEKLN